MNGKKVIVLLLVIFAAVGCFKSEETATPDADADTKPPRVLSTYPVNMSTDVDPAHSTRR